MFGGKNETFHYLINFIGFCYFYIRQPVTIPLNLIPLFIRYKEQRFKEKELLGDEWQGGEYFFVFANDFGLPHYQSYPRTKWIRF